jgi:hypothetical protein
MNTRLILPLLLLLGWNEQASVDGIWSAPRQRRFGSVAEAQRMESAAGAAHSKTLPAPAQWPALRHEQPLSLLLVAGKGEAMQRVVADTFDPQQAALPYDVIFIAVPGALHENLLYWVRAGKWLVVCGNLYPASDSPLAVEWPARPTPTHTWMAGGATRGAGPALAGVPVERLSGWTYIPVVEPTDGSLALATGESGAAFLRRVGKGGILFVPTGPFSRFHDAIRKFGRLYDHDEIWLRFWDQLLHETVRGERDFPAYTDLRFDPASGVLQGQITFVVPPSGGPARGTPEGGTTNLAVSVHVTTPRGEIVYAQEETVTVPVGQTLPYEVRVPVASDWQTGLYPVYLTVGDPVTKKQLHQSLEFLTVTGDVELQLAADKRGYRLGETATLTLTASSRVPWSGELVFGVYDFRGRLLGTETQLATLTTNAQPVTFSYRMVDHGVRVDTFWAQVSARRGGRECGWAEAKFHKYEPWSMRDEYQWSTWSRLACGPPSLVPAGMRLLAHAGMNALGNPGAAGIEYAAERWGWRFYNEGVGMNTFSPVIEYENDAEIETQLLKEAQRTESEPALTTAAYVIASIQEEGGFKHGWGWRYYWETPVAPEKAYRAFQWFLQEKYPTLQELNAAWNSNFTDWNEVKLTKEFSTTKPVSLDADGWAHPKESPVGMNVPGVTLAPFADTAAFYNWYYDKIAEAAKRIFRERINPVARVTASAPTLGTSKPYDVRLSYPSCWNESQWDSTYDGPEPGFGLIWGHFDSHAKQENNFWGWLLMRSGHNDYWVDMLNFNNDLTHTRASFAMRAWTRKLAGRERIILDSHPTVPEVGLLEPNGLGTDLNRQNMALSLKVALNQLGIGLPALNPTNLAPYKVVFAIGHQAVSREAATRITEYVEGGGTLAFTPRFASQGHGAGLTETWGLPTAPVTNAAPHAQLAARLDSMGERFRGLSLSTYAVFREQAKPDGWTALAHYDDGTPAVLTRPLGKGRLIWLNAIYQSHHYIQWVTPTGPERRGFYRLVEWICERAGVARTLRLEGDLTETLHMAVKQFTDPTGKINYVIARTSGEVPWTRGQLHWLGPQPVGYDVFGGERIGRQVPLQFKPGAGKLLAFVEKPVKQIKVGAASSPRPGEPITLTIQIRDADNKPVPGAFPLELRVAGIPALSRSFSLEDGGTVTLNTALSDPPGQWTITVTDGITGLSGSTRVTVKPSKQTGPGFWPLGWPSEQSEPARLTSEQFLTGLRALSTLYRADHTGDNWMTKQRLCYYYDNFPDTRHAYLRPLNDVDWPAYSDAIRTALLAGETFVLTGEDIGIHPGTGLATYPHHDAKQLEALAQALRGAKWSLATPDGDTIAASLGTGRFILCRESIDAAGERNPQIAGWQKRWLGTQTANTPIKAPSLEQLRRWWVGAEAITAASRTNTWFGDNAFEQTFTLAPGEAMRQPDPNWPWPTSPEGTVFTLVVPPTGEVKSVSLSVTGDAQFDIGNDGTPDTDWTTAVARAVRATPYRDGNGWRIIPVRVTVSAATEVRLADLRIDVQ